MPDETAVQPADITALRGAALVDALDRIDPTALTGRDVDLDDVLGAIDPAALDEDAFRRLLAAVNRLAEHLPELDLSSIDAGAFARLVAAASPAQLEAVLADPRLRERLLDEVFRRMGSHVRADRIKGMHSIVRWRLSGGQGPGGFDRYQCTLSDGTCTVSKEMSGQPRVTITLSPANFVQLITQQATPAVLFVTGKLQVKGDLGFAAGLIGYFDLPTP